MKVPSKEVEEFWDIACLEKSPDGERMCILSKKQPHRHEWDVPAPSAPQGEQFAAAQHVPSASEMIHITATVGACRGMRDGINERDETVMVTSQEVLLALVAFRLERIEQLLLEKRGR